MKQVTVSVNQIVMEEKIYRVIEEHTTEYPDPITFKKGTRVILGERYQGPENWDNWIFCETLDKVAGWVPIQILEFLPEKMGLALEDYTAKELNLQTGEMVKGSKILNGWTWCEKLDESDSGWVPFEKLRLKVF